MNTNTTNSLSEFLKTNWGDVNTEKREAVPNSGEYKG